MPNEFDRILKENSEEIFKPLIQNYLGINIIKWKKLPEIFTTTKQREIDFLTEVLTSKGEEFLLHIEFQTKFDKDMIYRMGEYHTLIVRRYKKKVKQLVIYLGLRKSKLITELDKSLIYKGFSLINLFELDGEELLNSQVPEQVILALLARNKEKDPELLLVKIYEHLKKISTSPSELNKYITQLNILARLRNFDDNLLKFIDDMPITLPYPFEEDAFYKRGLSKGLEKKAEAVAKAEAKAKAKAKTDTLNSVIQNLIKSGKSYQEISEWTGLTIKEIQGIANK